MVEKMKKSKDIDILYKTALALPLIAAGIFGYSIVSPILCSKNDVEEVVYNEPVVEDSLENVLENFEYRSFDYSDSNNDGLVDHLDLRVSSYGNGIGHSLNLYRGDDFEGHEDLFLEADTSYQKQVETLNDSGKLNFFQGDSLELADRISIDYDDHTGTDLVNHIGVYISSSSSPYRSSLHLERENDFEEYKELFLEADRYSVVQRDRFMEGLE